MSEAPKRPELPRRLPLLAVRDIVVFPHMGAPLSVGRTRSIKALEAARKTGRLVTVATQRKASVEDPLEGDLYTVGVLAEITQYLRMPDGTLKVSLQGLTRVKFARLEIVPGGWWEAELSYPEEPWTASKTLEALVRQNLQAFEGLLRLAHRAPPETVASLAQIRDPSRLSDIIAAHGISRLEERQSLLEVFPPEERLLKLAELLGSETQIVQLERRIHSRVRTQIQKSQKEYYLQEQMKAIQKELRQKDDFAKEIDELREKVAAARMPKPAEEASLKEIARLEKMMPFSPEATVCRSYLDWMIALPWSRKTRERLDIARARAILDEDHYGLQKAKERILEYLAVCKLTKKLRGPILCFVGPPGVGKTSLGRSIARAVNRTFVRISLGGVRDEAEIRGHRRTYIGSLPGRVIQSMRKAKSRNPVFLLDEIDKMGVDWRGDPAAALLEVLDPEQNSCFLDHYLDVEFDLSSVMFLCTANTLEGIPVSLQDRLEVIRFPGYTYQEKLAIAKGYLIPKQVRLHGLSPETLSVEDDAVSRMIHEYTREAGVRNLERELAGMCRKAARKVVEERCGKVRARAENLQDLLGVPKFLPEEKTHNAVGVATGLAWTEVGGQLLDIEAVRYPGTGKVHLTGKLGSVMQESAKASLSYIHASAESLGIPPDAFKNRNFHIHVPEGATPKDGPSAGIAIATALASLLTGRPVLPGLAMTGEITLLGRILPIGGLKEKVMAAHRSGVTTVLFPEQNRKDLEEIPKDVLSAVALTGVNHIQEVFNLALAPAPARQPRPRWKGLPRPQGKPDQRDGYHPLS
jgi:ATP-dependent Lon protease